jgi:hypothetical protein
MSVSCECCVLLSGRGLCDEPIPRPEESYRLWRVSQYDQKELQTSTLKRETGVRRRGRLKKKEKIYIFLCFIQLDYYICWPRNQFSSTIGFDVFFFPNALFSFSRTCCLHYYNISVPFLTRFRIFTICPRFVACTPPSWYSNWISCRDCNVVLMSLLTVVRYPAHFRVIILYRHGLLMTWGRVSTAQRARWLQCSKLIGASPPNIFFSILSLFYPSQLLLIMKGLV